VHDSEATAGLLRLMVGRRLLAITEARHSYQGRRDSDASSLVHFWMHFEGSPALMAHGVGDQLTLRLEEPYASYGQQEDSATAVAPAQEPDRLASAVGQQLRNAAPIYAFSSFFSGALLRFERNDLLVACFADEWLLTAGAIPAELSNQLTVGDWFACAD
jgi:hypothetical protein